jgi:multicomponent Na+:H+ antiporter subunit D
MIVLMMLTGFSGAAIPYIFSGIMRLKLILTSAIFYLISVILLGIFYVKNGTTSCVLLDIGSFNVKFHLEFLGVIFLGILSCLWCVAVVYSWYYLDYNDASLGRRCEALGSPALHETLEDLHPREKSATILSFMTLCIIAASLIALSANMITMFIFYELLTLLTIPLVFQGSFDDLGRYLRPLLYPAILLWLPAILYINYSAGSTDFFLIPDLELPRIDGVILLLLCIFGISKSAIMPLHTWLPAAMVATHPVSAMLHSVAVVNAGLFCIFKIMTYIFGFEYLGYLVGEFNWLIIIPGITIIYSGWLAFKAQELKQVLAYSTISQLSLSLLGIFLLSKAGLAAAVIHMLAHSASKITLFFAAGSMYVMSGKKAVSDLRGLYYQMPMTTALFCLGGLSLIGVPLFAGYYSKSYLYQVASEEYLVLAIITAGTLLTCLYIFKVVYSLFSSDETSRDPRAWRDRNNRENLGLIIPTTICAAATIGFPVIAYIAEKLLRFL